MSVLQAKRKLQQINLVFKPSTYKFMNICPTFSGSLVNTVGGTKQEDKYL
jgi:hypothetical protein